VYPIRLSVASIGKEAAVSFQLPASRGRELGGGGGVGVGNNVVLSGAFPSCAGVWLSLVLLGSLLPAS
jgi:hypothetical protein